MGCFDPVERDFSNLRDDRKEINQRLAELRGQLRVELESLEAARDEGAGWEAERGRLLVRGRLLLAPSFEGDFSREDVESRPLHVEPANFFPTFDQINAFLGKMREVEEGIEVLLCDVRAHALRRRNSPEAERARARGLHLQHRLEDRRQWLELARPHLWSLGGKPEWPEWRAVIERVEAMEPEALLDPDALPPLPNAKRRG